jgi:hypothetical protein
MNDSDNKAFHDFVLGKEFPDGIPDHVVFEPHEVLRQTWEAACKYKDDNHITFTDYQMLFDELKDERDRSRNLVNDIQKIINNEPLSDIPYLIEQTMR